jgi:hypothetical protein
MTFFDDCFGHSQPLLMGPPDTGSGWEPYTSLYKYGQPAEWMETRRQRRLESGAAMSQILDRDRVSAGQIGVQRAQPRPVLLATLSVRIDASAERMAISSTLDTGAKLILANMLVLPPYPRTVMLAPEYATLPHEEDREAVRATADRAVALGIETELLRVSSPRPVRALLELASDREVGLLVFGPDRTRLPRLRFRRAARAVRRNAPCLVWVAPDG